MRDGEPVTRGSHSDTHSDFGQHEAINKMITVAFVFVFNIFYIIFFNIKRSSKGKKKKKLIDTLC